MKRPRYTCKHCKHTWVPRKPKPKRCPNCRRTDWRPMSRRPYSSTANENSVLPGLFND